jgi:hypothetical protein
LLALEAAALAQLFALEAADDVAQGGAGLAVGDIGFAAAEDYAGAERRR